MLRKKGFNMDIARLSIIFCLLYSLPALSHEFWIDPQQYQVESGAPLEADLKNGQNFKGSSQAWFENRFTRFDMVTGETVRPVDGRMGDTPALQTTAPDDGLLIVAHETTKSTLIYREWEKFLTFAAHKEFQTAAETHLANGWPTDLFRETYSRHVKALIAIGDGQGQDREIANHDIDGHRDDGVVTDSGKKHRKPHHHRVEFRSCKGCKSADAGPALQKRRLHQEYPPVKNQHENQCYEDEDRLAKGGKILFGQMRNDQGRCTHEQKQGGKNICIVDAEKIYPHD